MKKIVLFILVIGYIILSYPIVAADAEDIPRPELVKIANQESNSKGKK